MQTYTIHNFGQGILHPGLSEYPLFDLVNREEVSVIERPLVTMESAVICDQDNNMRKRDVVLQDLTKLKEICRIFCGGFIILWHNSNLFTIDQKDICCSLMSHGDHCEDKHNYQSHQ